MRFTAFAAVLCLIITAALAAERRSERALKEGLRLQASGQFTPAEQSFTEAIGQDPDEPTAYLHRAGIRLITGRAQEALGDATAAVRLLSKSGEPFELRARILIKLGQPVEAIKDYDRAIELGLDTASAFNGRAAAEMSVGRTKDAIRDYSQGIKLRLDDPEPIKRRGDAYLKVERYRDAIDDYDQALNLKPNAESYQNRGFAYGQL